MMGETVSEVAAGLASLDVEIPQRGRLYRFMTPRGEIRIEARSVSEENVSRATYFVGLLVGILAVWFFGRERARRIWARLFRSIVFGMLIVLAGLICLGAGFLPLLGLFLILAGICIATRSWWLRRRSRRAVLAVA
jgi:hypothetical protein